MDEHLAGVQGAVGEDVTEHFAGVQTEPAEEVFFCSRMMNSFSCVFSTLALPAGKQKLLLFDAKSVAFSGPRRRL